MTAPSPQIAALIAAARDVCSAWPKWHTFAAEGTTLWCLHEALAAAEAAPIQPAPGVVTDAMVEAACKSFLSPHVPHPSFEGAMSLAIRAALAQRGGM